MKPKRKPPMRAKRITRAPRARFVIPAGWKTAQEYVRMFDQLNHYVPGANAFGRQQS